MLAVLSGRDCLGKGLVGIHSVLMPSTSRNFTAFTDSHTGGETISKLV